MRKMALKFPLSKVNFYLLRDPQLIDQYPLFQFLLKKGIVPRHTFNFPGLDGRWLRFAIRTQRRKSKIDGGGAGMAHDSSIIFITGGVRSGKSAFAEKMAMELAQSFR